MAKKEERYRLSADDIDLINGASRDSKLSAKEVHKLVSEKNPKIGYPAVNRVVKELRLPSTKANAQAKGAGRRGRPKGSANKANKGATANGTGFNLREVIRGIVKEEVSAALKEAFK